MDKKFRMLSGHRQRSRLMLCGVLALLILFNVIFHAFATRFRWYLYTSEQYTHEIGTASETLFSGNEEEVRVIFCMPEEELLGDSIYSLVLNTFRQLEARHDFLSVEFVNIYLHPSAVKPYRGEDPETGKERYPITEQSVIFVRGQGASEVFRVESLSSFFVLDEEKTITAYNGEEIGLSCIRWVLRDRHPVAAFTSTHGENFGELLAFATTLTASGYDLSVLDLHGEIPEEVELIVIANPRWDFDRSAPGPGIRSELDRLAEFLARGGSLFVSLDPYAKADLEGLRGFLAERGLTAGTAVIRDRENSITYDGYTLITDVADGPRAAALSDRLGAYTSSHSVVREASAITCRTVGGWQAEPLLLSSPSSECYEGGALVDREGSYPVFAVSSAEVEGGKAATVLLSSGVYLLADDVLNSATYENRATVLAALELASGEENPVGCRILAVETGRLEDLTMGTARLYAVLLSVVLPLAVLSVGGICVIRRKTR